MSRLSDSARLTRASISQSYTCSAATLTFILIAAVTEVDIYSCDRDVISLILLALAAICRVVVVITALLYVVIRFRAGMKDLEVMMINTISSAFETISTVEQGVELLDIFMHLQVREVCAHRY